MQEVNVIKQILSEYGLTQVGLSRLFNIPIRTVQDWTAGKRKPPEYVVNMIVEILNSRK